MRVAVLKLLAAIVAMPLSLVASTVPGLGFVGWFFALALVLSILLWFDLGRRLRDAGSERRGARALGVLMGVPQALFGIASVVIGVGIVGWVLYNTFIERQPEYPGGLLTFGMGPGMAAFGAFLVVDALRTDGHGDVDIDDEA